MAFWVVKSPDCTLLVKAVGGTRALGKAKQYLAERGKDTTMVLTHIAPNDWRTLRVDGRRIRLHVGEAEVREI